MKKFQISASCPQKIVFQSLPSGDYDYSEFCSADAAWDAEKSEAWVQTHIEEGGGSIDTARAEFLSSLTEAAPEDALKAAADGYTWPQNLGFVDEIEDEIAD